MVMADISQSADYDLVGEVVMEEGEMIPVKAKPKKRVALRVTAG
jgi:hypothetical protein